MVMHQPDLSVAPQIAEPIYKEIVAILKKHHISREDIESPIGIGNSMVPHFNVQMTRLKETIVELVTTKLCADF